GVGGRSIGLPAHGGGASPDGGNGQESYAEGENPALAPASGVERGGDPGDQSGSREPGRNQRDPLPLRRRGEAGEPLKHPGRKELGERIGNEARLLACKGKLPANGWIFGLLHKCRDGLSGRLVPVVLLGQGEREIVPGGPGNRLTAELGPPAL